MATDPGQTLQGGYLQRLPAGASIEQVSTVLNDVINRLNDQLQTQSFSDTTNKRFIQGYMKGRWPGGDFGIAISQPGKDVTTAAFNTLLFAWDYTTNKQYFYGGTQYFYDPTSGKNFMQLGVLPDTTGGAAIAKTGSNVSEIFN